LAEQKRIVAKVEELLARVKAACERLARVPAILERFRQAVLTAATSGGLTAEWRKNQKEVEPARALLERIVAERKEHGQSDGRSNRPVATAGEENAVLPDSWYWASVQQVTRNFDGKRVPIKATDRERRRGQYPYYGASGAIDTIDDFLFDGAFLLIAEDGANLLSRSTPIAFRANGRFWVNNHAHVVQTLGTMPLQYLELVLNGMDLQEYVTGSAQPKLTQTAMNRIPVPLPPLREQHEIVRRVEALFALADTIEKRVESATQRAEKLTQTILAKAFRGELVPTEAELARAEGRGYEPASALLERIKKERDQVAVCRDHGRRPRRSRRPGLSGERSPAPHRTRRRRSS
jgi:type I restriction enzyme S subunit